MIKGFIALFTSGIIFRFPILLGTILGLYMMFTLKIDDTLAVFQSKGIYILGFTLCLFYTLIFKRVYHRGGGIVDWRATIISIFTNFISYVVALVFSCLFVYTVSFGGFDNDETSLGAGQVMQMLGAM